MPIKVLSVGDLPLPPTKAQMDWIEHAPEQPAHGATSANDQEKAE
jgi:hypothetical protein